MRWAQDVWWISLGAFLGAVLRYALSSWISIRPDGFPLSTFLINITGSLAIGFVLVLLTERLVAAPAWRLLLVTGFLGAYTTFSSYALETVTLGQAGAWTTALGYLLASNLVGLSAALAGMALARAVGR